jgi:hypothetical protein
MPWRDAMARNLPDVGTNRVLDFAKLRYDFRQQMRASCRQHPLIAKHLAVLDVEHMHGMLIIELIDLAPVRFGESTPTPLLDEDPMAQTIGLLHFVAIMMFVFGGHYVNH